MKMIKGLETLAYEGRLKKLSFLPEEEKGQGGPHHNIPVCIGQLQRVCRISFHKEPRGEDKG